MYFDRKNQFVRWGLYVCTRTIIQMQEKTLHQDTVRIFMQWTEKHMDVKNNKSENWKFT